MAAKAWVDRATIVECNRRLAGLFLTKAWTAAIVAICFLHYR